MKRLEFLFTDQFAAKVIWMMLDVLQINLAFMLAYWVRYDLQLFKAVDPAYAVSLKVYWPFMLIFTFLLILVYRQQGIYRLLGRTYWFDEFYAIINGTATGTIITIVIIFLYRPTFYSRIIFLYASLITVCLLGVSRLLKLLLLRQMHRQGIGIQWVLIVGAGEVGRTVMRTIVANPEYGLRIVGFLDDNPEKSETDIGRFKAFGPIANLNHVLQTEQISQVIIALPWDYHYKILSIMIYCERRDIPARIVPDLFQMTINQMHIEQIAGIPMIGTKKVSISGLNQLVKRTFDLVICTIGLILVAPLMGLIALIIKLESPGPILFEQKRVGKNGRCFTIYKFRSMVAKAEELKESLQDLNEANGPLFKIKADPRITGLGKWLRKFSFDELPQLYNVWHGEMSLIGPRPPLPAEVEQYQEWHKRRLEVAPGLTGLGQINGRSELTFDEIALLDIYYIENWSLALDTKILLQTIPKVIFGSGAY